MHQTSLAQGLRSLATETFVVCTSIFFLEKYGYSLYVRLMTGPPFFALSVISAISAVLLTFGVQLVFVTAIALTVYAATL
jgi:hypothetical protein